MLYNFYYVLTIICVLNFYIDYKINNFDDRNFKLIIKK